MAAPKEIAPGLFHWTATHPEIKVKVSSYYLAEERLLLDPLVPSPGGMEWLSKNGPPQHIVLTNRLHSRHSQRLVDKFRCTVWVPRAGLHHVAPELEARPFDPGDQLPFGARVFGVGMICPDESAILLPRVKAAAVADGVVREGNGPLSFVSDDLLVDDPDHAPSVKRAIKKAYLKLAEEPFDILLLAHGNPVVKDGRKALREFAEAP